MKTPNDFGFVFLECGNCVASGNQNFPNRVKIGKNKGGYYKTEYPPEWMKEFFLNHSGCDATKIRLVWEE